MKNNFHTEEKLAQQIISFLIFKSASPTWRVSVKNKFSRSYLFLFCKKTAEILLRKNGTNNRKEWLLI